MLRLRKKVSLILVLTIAITVVLAGKTKTTSDAGMLRTENLDLNVKHEISVLSQNLRVGTLDDGLDNFYNTRIGRIKTIVNNYDADIKCFQECTYTWKIALNAMFPSKEYTCVYAYNDKKLCNPIYVKKDKFEVLATGSFKVSDEYYNSQKGRQEGRMASWIKVRHKKTYETLLMVNTHLDSNEYIQKESCTTIMNFVGRESADGYLICGDFNFSMDRKSTYNIMTSNGTKDMAIAAGTEGKQGIMGRTYHGYGTVQRTRRIDFFYGSSTLKSKLYTVINDLVDGSYPSDHYGILTYIDIEGDNEEIY